MMGLGRGGSFRLKKYGHFGIYTLDLGGTCWISIFAISIFGIIFCCTQPTSQWLQHISRSPGLYPWGLENPDFANDRAWRDLCMRTSKKTSSIKWSDSLRHPSHTSWGERCLFGMFLVVQNTERLVFGSLGVGCQSKQHSCKTNSLEMRKNPAGY